MVNRSVAIVAVASIAGLVAVYLWNGRDRRIVVSEPQQVAIEPTPTPTAPAAPAAPVATPSTPVADEASRPSVPSSGLPGTEFDAVFKKIAARHARFEREIPDPVWAPAMEASWTEFYSHKPEVVVSSIRCKTTLCEILLTGIGMDEKSLGEVALKPGKKPLNASAGGKKIFFIGVVTDGSGIHPVAVVTAMASP